MTMIERVARAICRVVDVDYDALPEKATYYQRKATSDAFVDRDEARDVARSVIEAMRYKEGTDDDVFIAAAVGRISAVDLVCAYESVIDAAVKEA